MNKAKKAEPRPSTKPPEKRNARPSAADHRRHAAASPGAGSFPIVGIGASAGGYESFTEFLKQLPANANLAVVLVQHLDPQHGSQLAELLSRSTRLPVLEVRRAVRV